MIKIIPVDIDQFIITNLGMGFCGALTTNIRLNTVNSYTMLPKEIYNMIRLRKLYICNSNIVGSSVINLINLDSIFIDRLTKVHKNLFMLNNIKKYTLFTNFSTFNLNQINEDFEEKLNYIKSRFIF